jgi:hypothetical protein
VLLSFFFQAKEEYSGLCKCLGNLNVPEDRQAMSEIKEYAVDDEGAWALSDDTIHFIGQYTSVHYVPFYILKKNPT